MNISLINMNLLVALDALLAEKSESRAATRLGWSQSSLSRALTQLRRLFADELLVRAGNEYQLTTLGTELVEPVREIMNLVTHTMERRLVFEPKTDQRMFRIAATDYASVLLLRPLMRRLSAEAPGVSLRIRALMGPQTEKDLEAGELDLAVGTHGVPRGHLEHEIVYNDRIVGAVSEDMPLLKENFLSAEEYSSMPHIHYSGTARGLTGPVDFNARTVVGQFNAWNEHQVVNLFSVHSTKGVLLVQEKLAMEFEAAARIKIVAPHFGIRVVALEMFWHPRRTADPAHRWLRSQLIEAGIELDDRLPPRDFGLREFADVVRNA